MTVLSPLMVTSFRVDTLIVTPLLMFAVPAQGVVRYLRVANLQAATLPTGAGLETDV